MKGEPSTPTFKTGRKFETRRIPDERHDARLGNFIGEAASAVCHIRLISRNRRPGA